jgi:hypothetical protein
LYLLVHPVSTKKQKGGAETTLPSQFFGSSEFNSAYTSNPMGTDMASTSTLIRPIINAMPAMKGGGESTFNDGSFSDLTLGGGGQQQVGGGLGLSHDAFVDILAKTQTVVPPNAPIRNDAQDALRFIMDCNLLHLMTRIKSERKRTLARRGAPVAVTVLKNAIKSSSFVIPL